jgi:hypothetical protein
MPLSRQHVTLAVGGNLYSQSTNDFSVYTNLTPGVSVPTSFTQIVGGQVEPAPSSQSTSGQSTYGWYVEPRLNLASRAAPHPARMREPMSWTPPAGSSMWTMDPMRRPLSRRSWRLNGWLCRPSASPKSSRKCCVTEGKRRPSIWWEAHCATNHAKVAVTITTDAPTIDANPTRACWHRSFLRHARPKYLVPAYRRAARHPQIFSLTIPTMPHVGHAHCFDARSIDTHLGTHH